MNSPIQGTAADIMKIAMIRVHEALKKSGADARILVQVHDELLLEVKQQEAEKVADLLRTEMEHAADLAVKLEVDVHTGSDWFEAK
jgi:DNA polymerase-1